MNLIDAAGSYQAVGGVFRGNHSFFYCQAATDISNAYPAAMPKAAETHMMMTGCSFFIPMNTDSAKIAKEA